MKCKQAKSKSISHDFYTPLHMLCTPWVDVSMDFVLRLPISPRGRDSIFVVVDRSVRWHASLHAQILMVSKVADLFFKEIVACMACLGR